LQGREQFPEADTNRDESEAWARQLETKRALLAAQQQARASDERDRRAYVLKHREELSKQEGDERHEKVRAQHIFDSYLGDAKMEVLARGQLGPSLQDVVSYDRTLEAFQHLAAGVARTRHALQTGEWQGHDLLIDDEYGAAEHNTAQDSALLPLEPQIRAALGALDFGESPDEDNEWGEDGGRGQGLGPGFRGDALLPQFIVAKGRTGGFAPSAVLPPALPMMVPPPPLLAAMAPLSPRARASAPSSPSSPMRSNMARWASSAPEEAAAAPQSARTSSVRDAQSLAALRRIRRTGPLMH